MQMISGKLKHLFHTLQALKVKVLLKVSFRSTGNVTQLRSQWLASVSTHPLCPSFLTFPIRRLCFGALDYKLVCYSFIIRIDMDYKNESEKIWDNNERFSFPLHKRITYKATEDREGGHARNHSRRPKEGCLSVDKATRVLLCWGRDATTLYDGNGRARRLLSIWSPQKSTNPLPHDFITSEDPPLNILVSG